MRKIYSVILMLIIAIPAVATLQASVGFNTPTGDFKSETGFPGGVSFALGGEIKIFFVGFGAEARYHLLGNTVADVEFPPEVEEYAGEYYEDVKIESYLVGGVGMIRLYPVDNQFIAIFGEFDLGFYHRGLQVMHLPIPTDLGAQDGMGIAFGVGTKLLPISPIKPMLTLRYEIGMGVGRSDFDALTDPDADEKKNATLFTVLAGVDLF